MFRLDGRTALVTGARTGIGRAIAIGLAQAGADLVLLGHGGDFSEVVHAVGGRAELITVDLTDPAAAAQAVAELAARRQIDVLVNNAGIIHREPAAQVGLADWQRVLAVNLDSVFALCQAVGAQMLPRGAGKIVNIASLLSFQGGINVSGYTASKHAVTGLTKALATEWAPHGIQVNAIAPGYIQTNNTAALQADPDREPAIRGRIPAGRWGRPEDLVGAAVFLCSPASDYVNGHVLVVDGGWMAR
ncbi:2-dehydro-3-deoxy-D-gluconate 5-dehydrogenase KduD [Kutzneria viridogrisea]|uniref:2-dehydro-3-deoxy-D-gluconate 5-dehydrogenase n=2 Tax=Kutzneria TaxID=43356 RepID=W5VZM6_9PSEU|nr:SDR family oxidoreductase [Kutzneria albida]AHH93716.1 2-dehydro-3-deoxy-D-gluconate 5-dehydrogenase [Kutzneria albida DSM 43870]MBA8931280.1 2-deoxy-D-gluconate 3-dehydrogenase [Kutzneria viridogrisea]